MSGQPCFLAIDSGTSRMKAALINEENKLVDLAAADLTVLHPFDGASEADMDATWEALCSLLHSLAERNPESWEGIMGIGITGQGDGAWMINHQGRPARPAVLWNDTRTKVTDITDRDGLKRYCQEHSVTPIFQGANYYILKWVKENEPEVFRCIAKVVHCKDWLNFKLTGNLATDFSDTSTSMLNTPERTYDFEVLRFLGLEGLDHLFAPNLYSDEITGYINEEAAKKTGLKAGIPVVAGSIDVAGVAAGAGAVEAGDTIAIIGTTCCVTMVLTKPQLDYADTRGSILCHQVRDRFLRLMAMSNGTASLDWVRKMVLPNASFADIERQISPMEVGSEGVIFQPYLYGERAPFRDASATGAFLGITARHTALHLIRASYEGLAMSLYGCYQALPNSDASIYVAGGGAASNVLCQIISDCLGRKLQRPAISELGIYGITRAIRKGIGLSDKVEGSVGIDLFEPNVVRHQRYMELSQLFTGALHQMDSWWQARDRFLKVNQK
ncbi:MAG: carbohydrate kinase [Anaerolineae bacterium]|nr:carbohydrate kinase [Anaerolineae bacterium]